MNRNHNRAVKVMNSPDPLTRIAYNFTQINDDETEIEIYDVIRNKKSYDWWTDTEGTEVTPADFKEKLDAVTTKNVTLRMNSSGGEVNAANVIAVAIQEYIAKGKKITCKIDGVCASAAVQIAISCSEVIMHKSALMMIHNPMSVLYGYYDSIELNKTINMLDATKNSIINYYADKTGLSKQKLSNMMDAETWMDGNEAVEKGFADRLMFDDATKEDDVLNRIRNACVNSALNLPEGYRTAINKITEPEGKKGESEMEIKTVQDLKTQYPELVNELRNEITNDIGDGLRKEGAESERARLKAIDEMQGKVKDEVLNKAKYETFATAENVAMEAIKTNAFVQNGVINALKAETKPADGVKGVVTPEGNEPIDEKKQTTATASEMALNYLKKMGKVEQ